MDIAIANTKDIGNEPAPIIRNNSSSAHYSAIFQAIKEPEEKINIDFTSDNTEVYNQPFRLRDLGLSIVGQTPWTWTWWDPQQSVETFPWGHIENPKRDPKQDMDFGGLSSSMEGSNSDPNTRTKQGPYRPPE